MKKLAFLMAVIMLTALPVNRAAARGAVRPDSRTPAAEPAPFNDVGPSDWFYPYIAELSRRNLTRGNPDGGYAPDSPLLVDEFIAFALRTLGIDVAVSDGYWARNFIERALRLRLIDDGQFERYDVPVTRGQIAEIAVRAAESGNTFQFEKYGEYGDVFTDIDVAANPEAIQKAVEFGVIAGYGDRTFRPDGTATRAEAAAIVLRMIDESYRLSLYGDIFFNPETDLEDKDEETGIMKTDKAFEFAMKSVETLRIRKAENGKAVISGVIPEVPEGYYFVLMVSFFDKTNSHYLGYASTRTVSPVERINGPGAFEMETEADADAVYRIQVVHSIPRISDPDEPPPYNTAQSSTHPFIINRYYESDGQEPCEDVFTTNSQDHSGESDLDFSLTNDIWGW